MCVSSLSIVNMSIFGIIQQEQTLSSKRVKETLITTQLTLGVDRGIWAHDEWLAMNMEF